MSASKKLNSNERRLVRRYLIWCYKTTKESLDRIDRYFTQSIVDDYIRTQLKKLGTSPSKVKEFSDYMSNKTEEALKKKFTDVTQKVLNADYEYLVNRFAAIENSIIYFLGKKELSVIERLYEEEFTKRIWEAREHS